jgi:hypothetical protein
MHIRFSGIRGNDVGVFIKSVCLLSSFFDIL